MTNDIQAYLDVATLKRSRFRWRVFGVLIFLGLLAALFGLFSGGSSPRETETHIARLSIDGLITGDDATLRLIRDISRSEKAKALIVRIDSPGGTTAGSEAIYEELRKLGKDKPVVAVMDTVAASGGYITALAADHIVARGNTLTGSIGVIFSYPEVSKLLDTLGVKMEEIKSGDLKAEPNPYKPITEKARAVSMAMVQDSFNWFVGLIVERRKMTDARARSLSDGRVYTGRQAKQEGLIDEIGGEDAAIAWLEKEKKIEADLPVHNWAKPLPSRFAELGFDAGWLAHALGLETATREAQETISKAKLDGLLVLWHPNL
jgi:protease IV